MTLNYLAPGIRIRYTYRHWLNRKSSVMRSKDGVVVRTIKHRNPLYAQEVAVIFDGNKEESIVKIDQLRIVSAGGTNSQ